MSQTKAQLVEGLNINTSAPADALVIDSSGRVGIGTTSPAHNLDISPASGAAELKIAGAEGQEASIRLYADQGDDAADIKRFLTDTSGNLKIQHYSGSAFVDSMVIDSSGNVSIGTSTFNLPSGKGLQVYDSSTPRIKLANSTTGTGSTDGSLLYVSGSDLLIENKESANMRFYTAATERMRIDSSGRLLVGTSSARTNYFNSTSYGPNLNIEGTSNATRILSFIHNDNSGAPILVLGATGGSTAGSNTLIGTGARCGHLSFQAADGSELVEAAKIQCVIDGTPGANDMPGRLEFYTTADGASSPTERMRITSDSKFGFNTTNPGAFDSGANNFVVLGNTSGTGNAGITIASGTDSYGNIYFGDGTGAASYKGFIAYNHDGNTLRFGTDGSERLRIDSSGNVGIGTSSPAMRLDVKGTVSAGGGSDEDLQQWNIGSDNVKAEIKYVDANADRGMRFGTSTAHNFAFQTNNTKRMLIDYSGGVFLGDSSSTNNIFANTNSAAKMHLSGGGSGSANIDIHGSTHASDAKAITFDTNSAERMRIDSSGNVFFASFDDSSNSGFGAKVNATTNSGDVKTQCISTASQYTQLYGAYFGSAVTFYVLASGNVLNTNNSYGQISDQKLKENIVDANSQWNNIKDVRVRNFNFIEGQTHTQIGVVAQELEAVSPGLIDEAPDRDEEGNDLGTVTKSVKYSVLYMKAVKALQEAMTRIETLETKVAALEAG